MKRLFVIILLLAFNNLSAGEAVSTINRLGAATEQYAVMLIDTPLPTKPVCAEENYILSFDKSTPHGRDMFALAMAALSADKKLMIYYSETTCGLYNVRTQVNRIDILK